MRRWVTARRGRKGGNARQGGSTVASGPRRRASSATVGTCPRGWRPRDPDDPATPPHGWIKHVLGFWRFSLRGLAKVRCEWDLVYLALNVKRLHVLKAA